MKQRLEVPFYRVDREEEGAAMELRGRPLRSTGVSVAGVMGGEREGGEARGDALMASSVDRKKKGRGRGNSAGEMVRCGHGGDEVTRRR